MSADPVLGGVEHFSASLGALISSFIHLYCVQSGRKSFGVQYQIWRSDPVSWIGRATLLR